MRVLITGGSGTLGYALAKAFAARGDEAIVTYASRNPRQSTVVAHPLDIRDAKAVSELISMVKPRVVVHCSALTNVDLCETDRALADAVNVQGTENVINACKTANAKIVYVSTEAVFDGSKDAYAEDDIPNAINYYGATKLKGEELVRASGLKHLIVRTSQPYGLVEPWHKTNTVLRAVEKMRAGESVREPRDWYNSPTYIPDFVNAVLDLIDKGRMGTYNVVGSDFVNRYDWAVAVAGVFGLDAKLIEAVDSSAFGLPAKRQRVKLSIEKITKLKIKMRGVVEGAQAMRELMA
ncbi:MAG: SDR family oxidoreductase [Candidatus Aenigmatarchaeota archaeon]|nr:MAG: SDR family oxidoreductase [Candidatus Aenigmarchaeota archaeon]